MQIFSEIIQINNCVCLFVCVYIYVLGFGGGGRISSCLSMIAFDLILIICAGVISLVITYEIVKQYDLTRHINYNNR